MISRRGGVRRRALRWTAWCGCYVLGLLMLVPAGAWVWWQPEPRSGGTSSNALWARHQWVGEPHTDAEYRALGETLRRNAIADVYFHAGPFEADGSVPAVKYAHAADLLAALRRYAPQVRAQAYLGQIREVNGDGVLPLDDPSVRRRILETDAALLDLGFGGIHYDLEPIYPDDRAFIDLLERTRGLTRARGKVLSVAIEQLTLADRAQPVFRTLLPKSTHSGGPHYPPRPTEKYLTEIADLADQVAIMTYDAVLPTRSLVGRHFAAHTERTLRLIGDRTTVYIGVPTYRPQRLGWAEDLAVALRGVRRGVDALDRAPSRPYGVAIYAGWTTDEREWRHYRATWVAVRKDNLGR